MEITQAQGQGETEGDLQPIYMKDEWKEGQEGWRSGGGLETGAVISLGCTCVCVCV